MFSSFTLQNCFRVFKCHLKKKFKKWNDRVKNKKIAKKKEIIFLIMRPVIQFGSGGSKTLICSQWTLEINSIWFNKFETAVHFSKTSSNRFRFNSVSKVCVHNRKLTKMKAISQFQSKHIQWTTKRVPVNMKKYSPKHKKKHQKHQKHQKKHKKNIKNTKKHQK